MMNKPPGDRRFPPWIVWFVLSAVLFLAGASVFGGAGEHALAQIGVAGAIAAVAVISAFVG